MATLLHDRIQLLRLQLSTTILCGTHFAKKVDMFQVIMVQMEDTALL